MTMVSIPSVTELHHSHSGTRPLLSLRYQAKNTFFPFLHPPLTGGVSQGVIRSWDRKLHDRNSDSKHPISSQDLHSSHQCSANRLSFILSSVSFPLGFVSSGSPIIFGWCRNNHPRIKISHKQEMPTSKDARLLIGANSSVFN